AETLEDVAGADGAVKHLAGGVELGALLGEDGHLGVDGLHDVIGAGRQGVVGGVAERGGALGTLEAVTEAVEAGHDLWGGLDALGGLLDRRGGERGFLFLYLRRKRTGG